ncbi:FAD-binding protein, partial [Candidatus Saccharibacteria bacterium]|nr:FAD-binding protein [Candidatus Saccharibacteria bacterium]
MYDTIIVGAGMAGLTAGIYLARANKKVLVLEGKAKGGQIINTLCVENWPGSYKTSGADLMKGIYEQAVDLGA